MEKTALLLLVLVLVLLHCAPCARNQTILISGSSGGPGPALEGHLMSSTIPVRADSVWVRLFDSHRATSPTGCVGNANVLASHEGRVLVYGGGLAPTGFVSTFLVSGVNI